MKFYKWKVQPVLPPWLFRTYELRIPGVICPDGYPTVWDVWDDTQFPLDFIQAIWETEPKDLSLMNYQSLDDIKAFVDKLPESTGLRDNVLPGQLLEGPLILDYNAEAIDSYFPQGKGQFLSLDVYYGLFSYCFETFSGRFAKFIDEHEISGLRIRPVWLPFEMSEDSFVRDANFHIGIVQSMLYNRDLRLREPNRCECPTCNEFDQIDALAYSAFSFDDLPKRDWWEIAHPNCVCTILSEKFCDLAASAQLKNFEFEELSLDELKIIENCDEQYSMFDTLNAYARS